MKVGTQRQASPADKYWQVGDNSEPSGGDVPNATVRCVLDCLKLFFGLLISALSALGAGSVTQSLTQLGTSDIVAITFNWAGDSRNGSVPTSRVEVGGIAGYIFVGAEVAPGSPAPTKNYSIRLVNGNGGDLLGGAGASLSRTSGKSIRSGSDATPINTALTFAMSGNSIANAKGQMVAYFQKPGLTARRKPSSVPEIAYVEDFGASCNGVNDDRGPIQAALDSVGTSGGTVMLLSNCMVSTTLRVPPGVTLASRSPSHTGTIAMPADIPTSGNLITSADFSGTDLLDVDGDFSKVNIEHLVLNLSATPTVRAIHIYNTVRAFLNDLVIVGGADGIRIGQTGTRSVWGNYSNIWIFDPNDSGIDIEREGSSENSFTNVQVLRANSGTTDRLMYIHGTGEASDAGAFYFNNVRLNYLPGAGAVASAGLVIENDVPAQELIFAAQLIIDNISNGPLLSIKNASDIKISTSWFWSAATFPSILLDSADEIYITHSEIGGNNNPVVKFLGTHHKPGVIQFTNNRLIANARNFVFGVPFAGKVDTFGTAVILESGDPFDQGMVGQPITINEVTYIVSSVTNYQSLNLSSSAGFQTGAPFRGGTGVLPNALTLRDNYFPLEKVAMNRAVFFNSGNTNQTIPFYGIHVITNPIGGRPSTIGLVDPTTNREVNSRLHNGVIEWLDYDFNAVVAALNASPGTGDWSGRGFRPTGMNFATLSAFSPEDGFITYCSDCTPNTKRCLGAGTGAIAKRLNGAWDCR